MGDPERIWLQNADDPVLSWEGRLWCQDKVWPIDETEGEPTEYIRADLLSTARAEARREALEEALKMIAVWKNPQELRLRAGEMTAQEMRTAVAVLSGLDASIRRAAALSELAVQDAELIEEPDPDLLRDDVHERSRLMKEYPDEE